MSRLVLSSLVLVTLTAGCNSKTADPKGACIVDYDDLGEKGSACTVDRESQCKAASLPPLRPGDLSTMKVKNFVEGKTCAEAGYATAGCDDIAIAWSFQRSCP
jgi:hypothetical protein